VKTIESLIDDVLAREGGYVDHPDDRGGATNFGITERVARASGYDGPMRELPRARLPRRRADARGR
jgi:lysozyme family protein